MGIFDQLRAGAKGIKSPQSPNKPVHKQASKGNPLASRDSRGRLLPGPSLNPGGRVKGRESQLREMLERAGWEQLLEDVISGAVPADVRLRTELGRWADERANGKALERSQNVDLHLGQPQGSPVALDKLSASARRELIDLLGDDATQLPTGQVVDAQFTADNLPSTDTASDQHNKDNQ